MKEAVVFYDISGWISVSGSFSTEHLLVSLCKYKLFLCSQPLNWIYKTSLIVCLKLKTYYKRFYPLYHFLLVYIYVYSSILSFPTTKYYSYNIPFIYILNFNYLYLLTYKYILYILYIYIYI